MKILVSHGVNKNLFYPRFVCIIIFLFSIINAYNSALFGQYAAKRTVVYILLAAIIVLESLFLILHMTRRVCMDHFISLLAVIGLYIVVVDCVNRVDFWTMLVHIGTMALWICTYIFIKRINYIKHDTTIIFITLIEILFFAFSGLSFLAQRSIVLAGHTIPVVNLSYYCLACLPTVLSRKNKSYKTIAIIVAVIVPLIALKRGAIITLVLMLLAYYCIDSIQQDKVSSLTFKLIFISAVVLLLALVVDNYTGGILFSRFTIESLMDGSGRSKILATAYNQFRERSFIYQLLGTGSGSSTKYIGITLHNDYAEFIYCFGIIGFCLYMRFSLFLFSEMLILVKRKSKNAASFGALFAFVFGLSVFEGVIFNFAFLYIIIQIAILDTFKLPVIGRNDETR